MCGRYSLFDKEEMYDRFSIVNRRLAIDLEPQYNVAPSEMLPVIVKHSPNQVQVMKWGIVPPWLKNDPKAKLIINARSETLLEKPMFKRLVANYYGGPFCQDKKSAGVKIQNPPLLLTKNVEEQTRQVQQVQQILLANSKSGERCYKKVIFLPSVGNMSHL